MEPDFSGYVTKAGLKCSDGRTITPEAFKHMDGDVVPLVWHHLGHEKPENVLGHVKLEVRHDGVYGHGFFNDSPSGQQSKLLVQHGDIRSLSIHANQLVEKLIKGAKNVLHGMIREVSLVQAGANPGALIDFVSIKHSDGTVDEFDDEAIIYTGLELEHVAGDEDNETLEHAMTTLKDAYDAMSPENQTVVHLMIDAALEAALSKDGSASHSDDTENITHQEQEEGTQGMPRNVFDTQGAPRAAGHTLTHAERRELVGKVMKTVQQPGHSGSFKEAFLQHVGDYAPAIEHSGTGDAELQHDVDYGIENIDFLFPDAKNLTNSPQLISRRMEWVSAVLNGTAKSPFSRIKTMTADITHDEARAKGYVKGNLKKEEWFALAKRVTTPQTIYKKQKLDRDDIIDITDLDVVAWLKAEMRLMLDEEIARAILVGDGREPDDDDKIVETYIRPIAYDDDFYNHKVTIAANTSDKDVIKAILRARPNYRGSGNPDLFTTEAFLTDLLLIEDAMGRTLYETPEALARKLRVRNIVTVDVMEDLGTDGGDLLAIMVNLSDYTCGADRGGATAFFDDFDIDYNQYKYLYEARMSGALTKFKSAITFSRASGTLVTANLSVPTFNTSTGVVTIPSQTGVTYYQDGVLKSSGAQTAVGAGVTTEVEARPASGYYFKHNIDTDWSFTRDA